MSRFGLVAAGGRLPFYLARAAVNNGHSVVAAAVTPEVDPELEMQCESCTKVAFGQLDLLIDVFKASGIKHIVLAGKVHRSIMFGPVEFDERMLALFSRVKDRSDDSVMLALVEEFLKEGFEVIKQTDFAEGLIPKIGPLSTRLPNEQEKRDIDYGHRMAKEIAKLDIGQTVVVKCGAILAVEAIEGTDLAIRRTRDLGGRGAVVVKVSKPQQDFRFDVPTVGLSTLESMKMSGATALAIDAGETFVLEKDNFTQMADELGISVIAVGKDRRESF